MKNSIQTQALGQARQEMSEKNSFSFNEFEEALLSEKAEQLVAMEFYKSIINEFKWSDYHIARGWRNFPSLRVKIIADKVIEFMFGHNKLRISFEGVVFTVSINDEWINAIKKIMGVLDYIDDGSE